MTAFIVARSEDINTVVDYLHRLEVTKVFQVVIKEYRRDRSKEQNALIHVWFSQISKEYNLSHGELYSPNVWKEHIKSMLLGLEIVKGPRGPFSRTLRTRDLKVNEMSAFMEEMVIYCATEFNIMLTGLDGK